MKIQVTNFAERHFKKSFKGTKITNVSKEDFERVVTDRINELPINNVNLKRGVTLSNGKRDEYNKVKLLPGYADFCKLLVIPNFTDAKTGSMPITMENFQHIRTGYSSRSEGELPVLSRWLEIPTQFIPDAKFLVIILYDRNQLLKEHTSQNSNTKFELDDDTDYGIVAILGQVHNKEEPMNPITMMRNALGKKEGGSGVPINKIKYQESVDFWSNNAIVRS